MFVIGLNKDIAINLENIGGLYIDEDTYSDGSIFKIVTISQPSMILCRFKHISDAIKILNEIINQSLIGTRIFYISDNLNNIKEGDII